MHYKRWSENEIEYLKINWGDKSLIAIARKLGRTQKAVLSKKYELNLCSLDNTVTVTEVSRLLNIDKKRIFKWREKGLKIAKNNKFKGRTKINFFSLVEFLKNNQDLWDSRKVELYALGKEYKWLKEKRENDKFRPISKKWTKYEELKLKNLKAKGLNVKEILKEFPDRTESSITHKMSRLNITSNILHWQEKEIKIMIEMDKKGIKDKEIAYYLGRETEDIRRKRLFLKKRGLHPGKKEIQSL